MEEARVAFFRGTFDALNFSVKETGERFYLVFSGDKVVLLGGKVGHRKMAGVEDLIHITFWTPGRPESSSVTLRAEGSQWYATEGLVGKPKRVFRLNQAETLDYMRHVHTTRKSANPKVWIDFVNWYRDWKERVSVAPATS